MSAQTARAFAPQGVDRNMEVQERIRRRKEARRPPQQAKAFGTAAAAAQRSTRNQAIDQNVNTAIGSQLQRRVQSGAIDPQQAKRVAGERSLLESKYGPDFRQQLFGGVGAFRKARTRAAANPDNERLQNVLAKLMARRKTAVEAARGTRDRNSYSRFKQGASS